MQEFYLLSYGPLQCPLRLGSKEKKNMRKARKKEEARFSLSPYPFSLSLFLSYISLSPFLSYISRSPFLSYISLSPSLSCISLSLPILYISLPPYSLLRSRISRSGRRNKSSKDDNTTVRRDRWEGEAAGGSVVYGGATLTKLPRVTTQLY